MDELLDEKQKLIDDREHLDITNEKERRIASNYISAKFKNLLERIVINYRFILFPI
jgi:transcription elongation factor GreB